MTFVRFLDVSNNQLVSLGPVVAMPNVEVLIADDNYIENFEGLQKLIVLHQISASRNRIELCQKVQMLTGCWRLTEVCLTGNPICEKADECEKLKQLWGSSVSL